MTKNALNDTSEQDAAKAKRLVDRGFVTIKLLSISSRIKLLAFLETTEGTAEIEIRVQHMRIVRMAVNGTEVFKNEPAPVIYIDDCSGMSVNTRKYAETALDPQLAILHC